jgi:RimJ/RimL family protein N-acetyltransferase
MTPDRVVLSGAARKRSRLVQKGGTVKLEALKDGTAVVLRAPTMDDVETLRKFFLSLPPEDQRYLRDDVTQKEVVERRIRESERGDVRRLMAMVGDDVVAVGALEFAGERWQRHIGEIRVVVGHDYRCQRLGAKLIAELFQDAQQQDVEKVVVRIAAGQTAARKICDRLGFRVDAVLPDHIKDPEGKLHAQVIMSCTLDELWRELSDFNKADDWPDG